MGDAPTRKEIAGKNFWHLLTLCEHVYKDHQDTETARKRRKVGGEGGKERLANQYLSVSVSFRCL